MLRGAPITVWRYISVWLWRLVLLTTAILVTVLAFALAVKFLAEGTLSPVDTLWFMLYAIPPMLQYALPFAGGLAATLTYHRFAADNEAMACRAGGVSYRSLLVPALGTGLVLSVGLIVLSNRIIPDFFRRMETMVTEDATRIMVNTMKRGEAFEWDQRTLVYADDVNALGPNPKAGAYQVLWLKGVLIVQLEDTGDIKLEGSAHEAFVWFYRDTIREAGGRERDVTRITLVSDDFIGRAANSKADMRQVRIDAIVPNPMSDDPKFFGWRELRELRDYPERMRQVNDRRRTLATLLAEREAIRQMRASLAAEGRIRLVDPLDRPVVIRAADLEWSPSESQYRIVPQTSGGQPQPIVMEMVMDSGERRRFTMPRAWLRSNWKPQGAVDPLTFEITLEEFRSEGPAGAAAAGERREQVRQGFKLAQDTVAPMMELSSIELLKLADNYSWDQQVMGYRNELSRRIDDLMLEVFSKVNERIAMAVACLVMVLTGGVMAMRLRDSLPLIVYLWSFFPALASVLTIAGGQQMVHEHGAVGLPVLWGGVGGLAIFTAAEYWKLRRF